MKINNKQKQVIDLFNKQYKTNRKANINITKILQKQNILITFNKKILQKVEK